MKDSRLAEKLAGEEGFEPSLTGPEPAVLPLDDSPKTDVTELKSRHFSGVVNDILPLISPQKAAEIGQLIQSQLPNPPNTPIISRPPADINAPIFYYFRHGSLVPALKSYYQTLTRRTKKSVFARVTRAWIPALYGGREVILC